MELPLQLPQKPPMVMVDALLECSERRALTRLLVRPDNIFVENGHLAEAGLLENIAQTAAAQAGFLSAQNGLPSPVGYIAAVANLEISALPALRDTIETTVEIQNQVFNVTIASGKITCGGEVLAQCEMKIFIPS